MEIKIQMLSISIALQWNYNRIFFYFPFIYNYAQFIPSFIFTPAENIPNISAWTENDHVIDNVVTPLFIGGVEIFEKS